MLKEVIQMLMQDPAAAHRVKNGQLELAGISEIEHKALLAALEDENGLGKFGELGIWGSVKAASAL